MSDDLTARCREVLLARCETVHELRQPNHERIYYAKVDDAAAAMARAVDVLAQELQYDVAIEAALAAARGEDR